MSKVIPLQIDNVLNGWTSTEFLGGDGQFQNSIAIDPEMPRATTGTKPSGILRPTGLEKLSGTNVNSHPVAIITQPKTSDIYVVLANGRLISYDSNLENETLAYDSLGSADGAFYQNDYIYITYGTNIARYGKLSGTPSMTLGVWTGATLGSQTALTSNTYPSYLNTGQYPQHFSFMHADNKAYVLDFKDNQGLVHYVKTDKDGTDDGSTYNALDIPFGMLPTCGCSFGTDIAIGATVITNSSVVQGKSAVYFWDTVDTSFYREVPIDGVLTALYSKGGRIYAWAGSVSGKGEHILYQYDGAMDFVAVKNIPEGFPPSPYAVDALRDRVTWGSFLSEPDNACVVYAYGGISPQALQSIYRSTLTHTSTDGMITALKYAIQGRTGLVLGGKNNTSFQFYVEKDSTTYQTSIFRSKMFNISTGFTVKSVSIPLATTLGDNMTVVPKLYFDEGTSTSTLRTINSTNYSDTNNNRNITIYPENNATGQNNFYLELTWSGTALCPVLLPISITVEVED